MAIYEYSIILNVLIVNSMTQSQALKILKTGANVFLTGEPGSGKTYTINQYAAYLRERGIYPAITASTGIAATHIGGMTVHSWSGIGIKTALDKYELDRLANNPYIFKRIDKAKVLIIDEVSMLSADTLAMVDAVCREVRRNALPFGGLQIVLVGDFFQLPPVQKTDAEAGRLIRMKAGFAYESASWHNLNPVVCYLSEQHRQEDRQFLDLLCAIRTDTFNGDHLERLETRIVATTARLDNIPKLFSHNLDVDRVNQEQLNKLPGRPKMFLMEEQGRLQLVEGLKKSCLSPDELGLKFGAAVMFTKNNPREGFVNGTLGTVEKFDDHTGLPIIKTREGDRILVQPMDWTIEDNGRVLAKISQLPLRLAWAITVHKSQGMSMDAAVMDLRAVFEFGQGYVALSRVRSLSGLHLLGWNERTFQVHPQVLQADRGFRAASLSAEDMFVRMPAAELGKFHENFIRAAGGAVKPVETKNKLDTYAVTLVLWSQGKTIAEIAEERNLTQTTILGHIEKLAGKGQIKDSELYRLITTELEDILPAIRAAFAELGADRLAPVFEKFQGRHSYSTLRIARILFQNSPNLD